MTCARLAATPDFAGQSLVEATCRPHAPGSQVLWVMNVWIIVGKVPKFRVSCDNCV